MTCHHSSADFTAVSSWPHPDAFVPGYIRQMHQSLELFKAENSSKAENGCAASLAALADVFKNSASTLNCSAPPQGQHKFRSGQRGILRGLKNHPELNGCMAVVKSAADAEDGDGRLEVYMEGGSRQAARNNMSFWYSKAIRLRALMQSAGEKRYESSPKICDWIGMSQPRCTPLGPPSTSKSKPSTSLKNSRWFRIGHLVHVTSRNNVFRETAGRVVAFDAVTGLVTVREASHEARAAIKSKYTNRPDLRREGNANADGAAAADSEPLRSTLTLEILERLELEHYVPKFM
jgi:hypothetical protein